MNSLISSTFSEVSYNMQIHLYIYEWAMATTLYMQLFFFISDGLFHTEKKIILIWFQSCSNWFCHSLTYFHIKIQFCSLIKFHQINYKEEKLKKKKKRCMWKWYDFVWKFTINCSDLRTFALHLILQFK